MTTLEDVMLPVFFGALTALLVYIAQDFGSRASEFEKTKIDEFREIRSKVRGQRFSPALATVVKLVCSRLSATFDFSLGNEATEDAQHGHAMTNGNLDQEIIRILYQAEPWTKAEEAARNMEDSAREVNKLDDIWYGNIRAGSRLMYALYLASILAIALIPMFYLNLQYLWYAWAASFLVLMVTTSWLYCRFREMRKAFERFEKDYYIR